jgi:hypothetical protein
MADASDVLYGATKCSSKGIVQSQAEGLRRERQGTSHMIKKLIAKLLQRYMVVITGTLEKR